jgi:hypothetical protein
MGSPLMLNVGARRLGDWLARFNTYPARILRKCPAEGAALKRPSAGARDLQQTQDSEHTGSLVCAATRCNETRRPAYNLSHNVI